MNTHTTVIHFITLLSSYPFRYFFIKLSVLIAITAGEAKKKIHDSSCFIHSISSFRSTSGNKLSIEILDLL